MPVNTTNVLLIFLCLVLILCFVLMIMNKDERESIESFDPLVDSIQAQLQSKSPEELKSTINSLQQRLIDYGYTPDMSTFIKKTELNPNSGKCIVSNAEDRDKYISKSDVPAPGPRVDLSQYVKKSSIPPEKVCPQQPEIDWSAYVKKSTLPPLTKPPPCIAPQVKVSAGLCRECPPAPSCPLPQRCPELKCPDPKPCPPKQECPPPAPCPTRKECKKCDEVRYIKVPTIITKTIVVDTSGNVVSQNMTPSTTQPADPTSTFANVPAELTNFPTTTFPSMSSTPNITTAQTLEPSCGSSAFCPNGDLNSEFKKYGIYGLNYN